MLYLKDSTSYCRDTCTNLSAALIVKEEGARISLDLHQQMNYNGNVAHEHNGYHSKLKKNEVMNISDKGIDMDSVKLAEVLERQEQKSHSGIFSSNVSVQMWIRCEMLERTLGVK